jgi:hypothetical protein
MGAHYINVGRKNREKENRTTEDPKGRYMQKVSRTTVTNRKIRERISTHNIICKIDISRNSSPNDKTIGHPWLNQEAVASMG